jgi:hypothetical protein
MAVYRHAFRSLQRSGDIREVNGDGPEGSDVRFMSGVFGRRDRNRPHVPRASAEPGEGICLICFLFSQLLTALLAAPMEMPQAGSGPVNVF